MTDRSTPEAMQPQVRAMGSALSRAAEREYGEAMTSAAEALDASAAAMRGANTHLRRALAILEAARRDHTDSPAVGIRSGALMRGHADPAFTARRYAHTPADRIGGGDD